jgi:hypothetical protein
MGAEPQTQYFVAKSKGMDNIRLSVFFAPLSDRFVIPKEVLRAQSVGGFASRSLWKLITGELSSHDKTIPTIEPSSIEQVQQNLDEFLRTQPADELFLDNNAPDDIKEALQTVQEALTTEAQTRLANILGLVIPAERQDDRPYPGQYL